MRRLILFCVTAAILGAADVPFRVGVCTHFSQSKGHLATNLNAIRQAGVSTIRDELSWRTVERTKGQYALPDAWREYIDSAVAAGLEPLIILDYGNPMYDKGDKPISEEALEGFARYSEFIVRTLKGKVRMYEIWNEWDIGIGGTTPGTAETYAALLAKVYPRIKAIAPDAVVMGGGMTSGAIQRGWLEAMLKAGALKSLDELSIHTYNYSGSGRDRGPEAWADMVRKVHDLVQKYSAGREYPITVTEMGWPTQIDRRGTPPEISAAYLSRMYLLGRSMPFLRGIWYYDFQDDGWKPSYNEDNFGIVRPDLTPKPAYFALKDLGATLPQLEFTGRVDAGDPDVWILKFERRGGGQVWAIWSTHEDDDWQVTLSAPAQGRRPVRLREVGRSEIERPWGSRSWADGRNAAARPNEIDLAVRETPWLVSGELDGVSVTGVKKRERPEALRGAQFMR